MSIKTFGPWPADLHADAEQVKCASVNARKGESMKKILLLLTFCAIMASSTAAEIVQYSDKYVSFEYDSEEYQDISVHVYKSEALYFFDTKVLRNADSAKVQMILRLEANAEEGYYDTIYDPYGQGDEEILSETERILRNESGIISYIKILNATEHQLAIIALRTTDENNQRFKYCKRIYDSVSVSDQLIQDGIKYDAEKESIDISNKRIYRNVLYSRELRDYIQQGITVCENYLNGQLSALDGKSKSESLADAVENKFKDSEYCYDEIAASYFPSLYFGFPNPEAHIIEQKQELEAILEEIDRQYN